MNDPLADVMLTSDKAESATFRVGTISDNSPLEVDMGGATGLSASFITAYSGTADLAGAVGHNVLVLQTDTDLVILGRIITGG